MWSPTHVQIIVQRARNVIAKGKSGTNDAYVIIQNGKEKFQTSIKEQSIDPVWHEECDLLLENKETDVIKLTVYHRNLFGLADEFLGQALITLQDLDIYERPKNRWYALEGKSAKKASKFRGEIEVCITFIVKSCANDKNKKKTGTHQSLLDIRGSLKNESHKFHAEKSDSKNTPQRKFSMSAYNKVPKLATRTLSFKLESLNTRRKSLVEKFLHKKHDSVTGDKEEKEEQGVYEPKEFDLENDSIVEEINKSQEEVYVLENKTENDNKIRIEVKNEVKNNIEPEIKNLSQTKPNADKLLNGSLKRAFSSSNVLLTSSSIKQSPKCERSSTLTSSHGITEKLPQFHAPEHKSSKKEENIINKSSLLKDNILRHSGNKETLMTNRIKALKNYERRHTIDINEMVPELMQSNIALKKRETQASPDSLYSSFESIVNKKSSKLDYSQKYESLNKEELIQLIETQQLTIVGLNEQINNLEDYIDNLLVRVIENSPRILQNPYELKTLLKI